MDRMLGNQYFIAHKFREAIPYLQKARKKYAEDIEIVKKLIICYVAVEALQQAVELLIPLLEAHPEILTTRFLADDECPCHELLLKWSSTPPKTLDRSDMYLGLGILNIFCHPEVAETCFQQAYRLNPQNLAIKQILKEFPNQLREEASTQ